MPTLFNRVVIFSNKASYWRHFESKCIFNKSASAGGCVIIGGKVIEFVSSFIPFRTACRLIFFTDGGTLHCLENSMKIIFF